MSGLGLSSDLRPHFGMALLWSIRRVGGRIDNVIPLSTDTEGWVLHDGIIWHSSPIQIIYNYTALRSPSTIRQPKHTWLWLFNQSMVIVIIMGIDNNAPYADRNEMINHRRLTDSGLRQTAIPGTHRCSSAKCSRLVLVWFILRPCQHDNGYVDGRSQIKVHTDERTQVHSARSSMTVTHPSTNRGRLWLTS